MDCSIDVVVQAFKPVRVIATVVLILAIVAIFLVVFLLNSGVCIVYPLVFTESADDICVNAGFGYW